MAVMCLDAYETYIVKTYREQDDLQVIVDDLLVDFGIEATINDVHYHLEKWQIIPAISPVHRVDDWHDWHSELERKTLPPGSPYHRCQHCISQLNSTQDPSGDHMPLSRYFKTLERHEEMEFSIYACDGDVFADYHERAMGKRHKEQHLLLSRVDRKLLGNRTYRQQVSRPRGERKLVTTQRKINRDEDSTATSSPKLNMVYPTILDSESLLASPESTSMILTDEAGTPPPFDSPALPLLSAAPLLSYASIKRTIDESYPARKKQRVAQEYDALSIDDDDDGDDDDDEFDDYHPDMSL